MSSPSKRLARSPQNLTKNHFYGNAPTDVNLPIFNNTNATIYYLPDKTGWNATFAGKNAYLLTPISILTQPTNTTANRGDSINFTVETTGYFSTYQWRKNSIDIAGATSSTLNLNNIQTLDEGSYTVTVTNAGGSVTSNPAILTVISPPLIITNPFNVVGVTGDSATLRVVVTGSAPTYQWIKNGVIIEGANQSELKFNHLQLSNVGVYQVLVSNPAGSVTSNTATLTVNNPPLPVIILHPDNLSVAAGASAAFSISAVGTSFKYQWKKNGMAISGATGSTYTIPSAQTSDAGSYTVTVSNAAGGVTSNAAALTVSPPPPSITSDLSTVSISKGKLIPRFTITTNFGAKTFATKGLPKGLKLNTKNGVISGKPTKAGTYTVTLTAKKMKGKKVEQQATAKKVFVVY